MKNLITVVLFTICFNTIFANVPVFKATKVYDTQQQSIYKTNENLSSTIQKIDETLNQYTIVDLNVKAIQKHIKSTLSKTSFKLIIDDKQVTISVYLHDILSDDFKHYEQTTQGLVVHTKPTPFTYRGYTNNPVDENVVLTIRDNWLSGFFMYENERYFLTPIQQFDNQYKNSNALVFYTAKDSRYPTFECMVGSSNPQSELLATKNLQQLNKNAVVECTEFAVAYDQGFKTLHNDAQGVQNIIISRLNMVSNLYTNWFDIDYLLIELYEAATNEITPENNYESCQENFPNCSENTILDDFREWGEGQAQSPNFGSGFVSNPDVATFWTSRDIVDGFNILNIGYSHFEGICNDRGYNICEDAERYRGNEPMQMTLWAHELGHTWNAYHTNLDDTHMMNSNVTSVAVNVDPNTTSAIAQHKATRACLDNGPCNTCAGVTAQITGLPATTSSTAPIALIGNPPGGTFSGTGVVFNGFNPSIAGPGNHTITYNYDDGNGCTATATQDILVFTIIFNFVNYGLGTIAPKLVDVNIEFQLNEPDNFNFQIFNVQGQMIYRDMLQFESGYNIENFTVPQLQKGAYVARIFNDEFQVSKKFVVSD